MRPLLLWPASACLSSLFAALPAQDRAAGLPDLGRRLRELPPHPRLFLGDEALRSLKARHADDEVLRRYVQDALASAESLLQAEELRYDKRGPRLLHVSRACLRRIQALGLAYRWTGRDEFAGRAVRDLLTVCAFPDWNPSHFLDVAEMSHAVGLGYDWLHGFLSADDDDTILRALVDKGLLPGTEAYGGDAWWTRSAFNWNQVCNGGLLVGALAVAEEEPELARGIVEAAVASLPAALASYEPDGAWMEGPAYWDYATRYTAYGLDALRTALGTDFGLGDRNGLRAAGWFPNYTAGPTGLFFNYADAGERARRRPSPCMLWLAGRYDDSDLARAEHALLREREAGPFHVVWYRDALPVPPALEPARLFRGKVPVAVFRGGPQEDTLFAAIKGGYNQVNHGHLDLGAFVLDALGTRWAEDLGSDDYNLPGYWQKGRDGKRWDYFRLNSKSHNVPLVGGEGQDPMAEAEVVEFREAPPMVLLDLGDAYPKAEQARRGLAVLDWRSVLVQDEIELEEGAAVTWGLTTRAEAEVGDDGTVTLRRDGEELLLRALAPAGAAWQVRSAEQESPQRRNQGVRRVELTHEFKAGGARIAVQLCPVWPGGAAEAAPVRALEDW